MEKKEPDADYADVVDNDAEPTSRKRPFDQIDQDPFDEDTQSFSQTNLRKLCADQDELIKLKDRLLEAYRSRHQEHATSTTICISRVNERIMAATHFEQVVREREKSCQGREVACREREEACKEREANLREREATLREREACLREREATLKERKAAVSVSETR